MKTTKTLLVNSPTDTHLKARDIYGTLKKYALDLPKYEERLERIRRAPNHVLSIGAGLYREGHDVDILDLCTTSALKEYDVNKISAKIKDYDPDILGFTTFNANIDYALEIAKAYQEINPDVIVVFGGPQADFMPDEGYEELARMIKNLILVQGEGERAMLEIAGGEEISSIKGLVYTDSGRIFKNEPRPFTNDLDEFASVYDPDFLDALSIFNIDEYTTAGIWHARGCPWSSCKYCVQTAAYKKFGFKGQKVRAHSTERTIEEIRNLNELGVEQITFSDSDLLADKKDFMGLAENIKKEGLITNPFLFAHPQNIDEERAKILGEIGTYLVSIGVDSLNEHTLDYFNRSGNHKAYKTQIERGVMNASKNGVRTLINIMVGLPTDKEEDVLNAIEFVNGIDTKNGAGKEVYLPIWEPFCGTKCGENDIIRCPDLEKARPYKTPTMFDTRYMTHGDKMNTLLKINRDITLNGEKYNISISIITDLEGFANLGEMWFWSYNEDIPAF